MTNSSSAVPCHPARFKLAVLLVLVLIMPGLLTLLDILDGADSARQESVAKTPTLLPDIEAVADFPGDFRHYIKQRFGFKQSLVSLNSKIKELLFGVSPYPSVLKGKDGFLFLGAEQVVEFTQGVALFDEQEMAAWENLISNNASRIESLGSRYELVLTPNKHSIYSDRLPDWINAGSERQTRSDQLLSLSTSKNLPVHDLRSLLRQQRDATDTALLFYKTDTHWNEYAAGLAVNHLLSRIGLQKKARLEAQSRPASKAGDLARMIGQQDSLSDTAWSFTLEQTAVCRNARGEEFVRNQTDPFRFEQLRCVNDFAPDVSAVVFMDSFGVSMIPAFAAAFRQVTFRWQYSIDSALVARLQADYVIHQITERKLQSLRPESL